MVQRHFVPVLALLHLVAAEDVNCNTNTKEVEVEKASALLQVDFKGEKIKASQVPDMGFQMPPAATDGPSGPEALMSKLQSTFGASAPVAERSASFGGGASESAQNGVTSLPTLQNAASLPTPIPFGNVVSTLSMGSSTESK